MNVKLVSAAKAQQQPVILWAHGYQVGIVLVVSGFAEWQG